MAVTTNYDGYITNEKNSKRFFFRCVTPFNVKKFQPSIDIPLINTSPENRFIFKFTGQSQDISFNFVLYNDGDDCSNLKNKVTIQQQAEYLMDDIFTKDYDGVYTLVMTNQFTGTYTGVIENIDLSTPTSGNIRTGSITFKRGRIGGL